VNLDRTTESTQWRVHGPYLPSLSSKAGLLEETRLFLITLARTGNVEEARRLLVDEVLPQRSRSTRQTIAKHVVQRLARWKPPEWVLDDLIRFARDERPDLLRSALLVHVPRQDALLYDVVQALIVRRWEGGEREVLRADVQRFLDRQTVDHPEVDGWSHSTRAKVAGNALSLLRDYGLLKGTNKKRVVEPVVYPELREHLARLLREEGVPEGELHQHPDWRLWLWDSERVRAAVALATELEAPG
jgi:hypothetical protein